jgi:hypothetical protein
MDHDQDEERAADIADLQPYVAELVRGHAVLELAYEHSDWTAALADTAAAVDTRRLDVRQLPEDLHGKGYTCVFVAHWWARLTRREQDAFLVQLRARVGKDVLLVLLDDEYVEGYSLPVARTDAEGNTYQFVTAPDGQRVELTKNYPSDSALRKRLASAGRDIRIERWEHFWLLTCRIK